MRRDLRQYELWGDMPPILLTGFSDEKIHVWKIRRAGEADLVFATRKLLEDWVKEMIPHQITNSENIISGNGDRIVVHEFTIAQAREVYPAETAPLLGSMNSQK